MKLNRRQFSALLGGASVVASAGFPRLAMADGPVKVGFVYLSQAGDFGWTYQHDVGRKEAEAALLGKITTTVVENISEGPEALAVFEKLASTGHKLIFGTTFGYMNYMLKVAAKYPDVKFEHATGYKRTANLATYNIRFYQGRFVEGVIAGKLSKNGVAGYIASVPVPEVVQGMNAFVLGMRSVNPNAKVKFITINSWYDPGKEGDAAKVLLDQGCDILTQHTDSPAPLQVAASRGVLGFGQSTDMITFAPKNQLTANVDDWGSYYTARIKALLDGTWRSTDTWGGFNAKMLHMAPFTNMPPEVASFAEAAVTDISSGKNKIFVGPIADQSGKIILPAGATLDDAALWVSRPCSKASKASSADPSRTIAGRGILRLAKADP